MSEIIATVGEPKPTPPRPTLYALEYLSTATPAKWTMGFGSDSKSLVESMMSTHPGSVLVTVQGEAELAALRSPPQNEETYTIKPLEWIDDDKDGSCATKSANIGLAVRRRGNEWFGVIGDGSDIFICKSLAAGKAEAESRWKQWMLKCLNEMPSTLPREP